MVKLDLKDRKILLELDMNARIPINELAKKLGLSRQTTSYRIERMKKNGIIFGALTIFDSVVVGYNWYRLVIRLGASAATQRDEVLKFLSQHANTLWLGEVGGNWDVVVNFVTKDNYNFNLILEELLTKYGRHIQAYETLVYTGVRDQSKEYILGGNTERLFFEHIMKFDPDFKLDETDKKIIQIISLDAMLSNWQVASKVGVSDKTVSARIKRMEEKKLILGYRLYANPSPMGYETYMVFLEITNLQSDRELKLSNFLKSSPNVTFVVKHIGKWRIGMEIEVKNRLEFQDFLIKLRSNFGDIISNFETFPIFKDHVLNYFPSGIL
ncbi:Lrp/AsnC family transcriptional regulator [Candidatus Micrarchaeota archaeon]|nr:Lrp/AsnC family transcriptional regulator [Candidatus Micrarchaeota archaeon]